MPFGRAGNGRAHVRLPARNPRSSNCAPSPEELAAAAERLGVTVHVLEQGEDPAALARAAPAGPLGIAGGDGSLGAVAAVAVERDLPFVCVPFGTRNHSPATPASTATTRWARSPPSPGWSAASTWAVRTATCS